MCNAQLLKKLIIWISLLVPDYENEFRKFHLMKKTHDNDEPSQPSIVQALD